MNRATSSVESMASSAGASESRSSRSVTVDPVMTGSACRQSLVVTVLTARSHHGVHVDRLPVRRGRASSPLEASSQNAAECVDDRGDRPRDRSRCWCWRRLTVAAAEQLVERDRVEVDRIGVRRVEELRVLARAAPRHVFTVGRRAPDDVRSAGRWSCPRRCSRESSAVPHTMFSRSIDVPQTMFSQSSPPQAVPQTMFSRSPSVPQTMFSSSPKRAPDDVLGVVDGAPDDVHERCRRVPQTMFSQSCRRPCPRRCSRRRRSRCPRRCSAPTRCHSA